MKMNRTKLLVWIIIVLIAINLATIISGFIYSSKMRNTEPARTEIPFAQRADFFHNELGLTPEQKSSFLEFNREYNQDARVITNKMNLLRHRMIKEMATDKPDKQKLEVICSDIGILHSQLKMVTVDYYLKMKDVCDGSQQALLSDLFERMLDPDGNIYGRGRGGPGKGRVFNQSGPGRGRGINRN